ncbi:hypothetical protein [Dactylosporangium matsuzakiense]|uniref:hypothetical protein n=1 Tax=Dactylosporangium matsuzakiense TaxID=53360 RepID=UPI0021C45020|nr:hypothetical protein [Dactylosporangium matsuzakiense]
MPIQFFDSPFRWDNAAGKTQGTAALELRDAGVAAARRRTQQPYERVSHGQEGPDLLAELERRFAGTGEWQRPIVLVTAPAGSGKSMLFKSLFAGLHRQVHGRQEAAAARPAPAAAAAPNTCPRPTRRRCAPWSTRSSQTEYGPAHEPGRVRVDADPGLRQLAARRPRRGHLAGPALLRVHRRHRAPRRPPADPHLLVRELAAGHQPEPARLPRRRPTTRSTNTGCCRGPRSSIADFARIRLQQHDQRLLSVVDERPRT